MPWTTDVIYRYDGSFCGLLCCVFESYVKKEIPLDIVSEESPQGSLYPEKWIETIEVRAQRVYRSLGQRIHPEAGRFLKDCFLTCLVSKEILIYRFINLGYRIGGRIFNNLTEETVHILNKAVKHLYHETHLLTGFVRFSDCAGTLVSVIEPKNNVLPLLSGHFCDRYPEERFLIYDKTHRLALVYQPYQAEFLEADGFLPPEPDAREENFRNLWKKFHETIAIEGRYNPKCQRTHLPIRYRDYMTEFQQSAPPLSHPVEFPGTQGNALGDGSNRPL